MNLKIKSSKNINEKASLVTIVSSKTNLPDDFKSLSKDYIKTNFSSQKPLIKNELENINVLALADNKDDFKKLEGLRVNGYLTCKAANSSKIKSIQITGENASEVLAFTEGLVLANYQFNKYFTDKKDNSLSEINIVCDGVSKKDIDELTNVTKAVYHARTLVNEPQHFLTATQLSEEIKSLSKEAGFTVEVFTKKKIETLKMGGLLAVNKGSVEPPTFNILEYKPKNPSNNKPIVLVGKGVVYDTGGLSLKPTSGSMDFMKSDMGGSAAVVGALYATAKNKLDVWVVGLIPATDNRPSGAAYAPGDVITMYNGKTVEVLNTDAEGRMILADALTYAIKYNPELVIDLATLTGMAARTVGHHATVSMGTADKETHESLKESGFAVHERLAEMPFFDEYFDMLKSDIADVKNIGGMNAGAITAGKFLEMFTKNEKGEHAYPWIHLDIAGPAFLTSEDAYRGKNGSGVGVRLLYNFIKKHAK